MRTVFDEEAEGTEQEPVRMNEWQSPEGMLIMELPEGFTNMEENRRDEYFPLEGRPEIILEHGEEDAQMTLQIFDRQMKAEEAEAAVVQMQNVVEENFTQYQYSPVYLELTGEIRIGWFLMLMKDIGREHIKAVFSVRGKMALLTITYPERVHARWYAIWRMILASMKEKKEDGAFGKWRF